MNRILSRRGILLLVVLLVLVGLDQLSKIAVELTLPLEQPVPVFPGFFLYRTYNLGVAFSMLKDMSGTLIVGMRLVIVAFVLWLWRRSPPGHRLAENGYTLIIAGAVGNIIDRFLYGHVIDFALFSVGNWSFAVFNLADSFITIGAGLVILDELLAQRKDAAKAADD